MSDRQINRQTDGDAGRWMSYAQLAEVRGISKKAAQRLTLRHRWRRQPANDGGVMIWVPDGAAAPVRQTDRQDGGSDDFRSKALAVLEAALMEANKRADAAQVLAERTLAALTDANARTDRADAALAGERQRADALRAQIDVLNAAMVATGAEADPALADERMRADQLSAQVEALSAEVMRADALRHRIEALQEQLAARQEGVAPPEAIRQAEAMVDSLREAHAGEVSALKAERHRLATQIDGFATRADQAEARADSLRARVDVLQRERDAARAQAQEAAKPFREAEAARKARGLVARLRAAWRGE